MSGRHRPILCVDFDGVIHAYTSKWTRADEVLDGPVPGAIRFLANATEFFEVAVFSSRSQTPEGIKAMQDAVDRWYREHMRSIGAVYSGSERARLSDELGPVSV